MSNKCSSLSNDLFDLAVRCNDLWDYWNERPITRHDAFQRVKVMSRVEQMKVLLDEMEAQSIPPEMKRTDWPF